MTQQKNNITEGLDALLGGKTPPPTDQPLPERKRGFNLGHGGRSPIKNRYPTSLIVNKEKYAKIRHIAIANGLNINEVIDVAFDMAIEAYEKKYGVIPTGDVKVSASEVIRSRKR